MSTFFVSSKNTHNRLQIAGIYLLCALVVLGALNSKALGAAWLLFWSWVFFAGFKTRNTISNPPTISTAAASVWFSSCLIFLTLASICAVLWSEGIDVLNAPLRLFLAAAAALILIRNGGVSSRICTAIFHAISLACIFAFAWTLFMTIQGAAVRQSLASNAIPWAVAISFYPCLLLPIALTENKSTRHRWIWILGTVCGIGAVLLAQSRGAYLVIPWCGLVCTWFYYKKYGTRVIFQRTFLLLISVALLLLACLWFVPGDAFRTREAIREIKDVQTSSNYHSSTGARLYLWTMAWEGIKESPWIGIGGADRLRKIKHAGDGETKEAFDKLAAVRELGHVHNQYLHSAWDGGLIGLAAILSLIVGLAMAVRRLTSIDSVAAWQLAGVLVMHVTSNLTNVNFAHNYYVLALSLATVIPLLAAHRRVAIPQVI